MKATSRRAVLSLEVALVLAGLAAILVTFRDYGTSWDESTNLRYGDLILNYFASGLRDHGVDQFLNMRYYGPLFDLLVAAVSRLGAPAARVEIHHLATALAGLATLPAVLRLGRLLGSRLSGLCGAAALATMPVFYGHAFVNGKDIPFACAFAWSMVALIELFVHGFPRWPRVLICGLSFGATAAIRPGALILLIPVFLFTAALAAVTGRLDPRAARPGRGGLGFESCDDLAAGDVIRSPMPMVPNGAGHAASRTAAGPHTPPRIPAAGARMGGILFRAAIMLGALAVLTWTSMIAFWPWAHASPIARPVRAILIALDFPAVYPVLFEGRVLASNALPRRYLLEYVAITTPPATLLLALLGLALVLRWQITDRTGHATSSAPCSKRAFTGAVVVVWLAGPLAVWTVTRPNIVDGLRHFLFVLPALALLAGIGSAALIRSARRLADRTVRRMATRAQPRAANTESGPRGSIIVPPGEARGLHPRHARRRSAPPARASLAPGAAALIVAALLLSPIRHLVRMHPYQMTYFNGFVGGLAGAAGRYETDYWLTSYKEAMEWIAAAAAPVPPATETSATAADATTAPTAAAAPVPTAAAAPAVGAATASATAADAATAPAAAAVPAADVDPARTPAVTPARTAATDPAVGAAPRSPAAARPVRVLAAANGLSRLCAEHYAGDTIQIETIFELSPARTIPAPFDFYLATTRYGLDRNFPDSPVVHSIGRDGATFAVIRRRAPAPF